MTNGPLHNNKAFLVLAFATVFILLIPLLLMLFEVKLPDPGSDPAVMSWSLFDFILLGMIIFSAGSAFILLSRILKQKSQKIAVAIVILFAFLWLWAELAVGIVTNWGS